MNLLEKMITGAIVTLIIIVVPKIYKKGEQNKIEHIKKKKIYYGTFRMIGLYSLAIMSDEMILMMFLDNSNIDGKIALFLTIICSIPVMIIYLYFYKNHYKKLINAYHNNTNCNNVETTKKTFYCKACGGKLNEKIKCKKCGKQYLNTKLMVCLVLILVVVSIIFTLLFSSVFRKNNESNYNQYRARHILVYSETEANVVIYKLNHGEDFCELAEEYSQDDLNRSKCGDLGYFSDGDMVIEFENAVKELDYNEYTTEPVRTEHGYHIIMRIR